MGLARPRIVFLLLLLAPALAKNEPQSRSKLPGINNSTRLEKLFQEISASNKVPIVFGAIDKSSGFLGLTTYQPQRTFVQIREGLSQELRENAIAHELFHVELDYEGYPVHYPQFGIASDQATMILVDCVHHPIIDSRMRKKGWKPELILDPTIENYTHPNGLGKLNESGEAWVGVQLYCLSLRVSPQTIRRVEDGLSKVSPNAIQASHTIKAKLGSLSCSNPDSCLGQLKKLRALVTNDKSIIFINPKTGLPE